MALPPRRTRDSRGSPHVVAAHPRRVRIARGLAIVADVLQLVFLPLFAGGWLSPLNDVVDVLVALILIWLIGWHLAFLPTFIAEVVPGLDLIPTWTAAVWFATRRGRRVREVETLPEDEP